MNNPYQAPHSDVAVDIDGNNSGQGEKEYPEGVKGWSWGAFCLNWIWACFNKSYIGLLAFIPYIGFFVAIYLGIKGREMAWRNKRWGNIEHFNRVQKRWSVWGLALMLIPLIGILAAIALPAYQDYVAAAAAAA